MRADVADAYVRAATSDLFTAGLAAFARWLSGGPVEGDCDADQRRAAELLGIDPYADEAEIRAALRARMVAERLHPDHGGDAELARDLIAAQNLLIACARARRIGGPP